MKKPAIFYAKEFYLNGRGIKSLQVALAKRLKTKLQN